MQPTFERRPGKQLYTPREGLQCFGGFGGYLGGVRAGGGPAWSPLDDVGTVAFLALPGGYSISGVLGVNAIGTWADESGNGNHAVSPADGQVPAADPDGWPIFQSPARFDQLVVPTSLCDDLGYPANHLADLDDGGVIVVAEYAAALLPYAADYANPAVVSGTGATPGLYLDAAGARMTGYDNFNYINSITAGASASTPYVMAMKWDATGIYSSLGGGNWSAVTAYTPPSVSLSSGNIGANFFIGASYSAYWTGPIKAVAVYPSAAMLDNTKIAQWQTWALAQGYV